MLKHQMIVIEAKGFGRSSKCGAGETGLGSDCMHTFNTVSQLGIKIQYVYQVQNF